jgi:hypothetical protein
MSWETDDISTGLIFKWHWHYFVNGIHHRMHTFHFALAPTDWTFPKLFQELLTEMGGRIMYDRAYNCVATFAVYQELFPIPIRVIPIPMVIPGAQFSPCTDTSKAATMSMFTGLRGPKNRGRKFIVGLPDNAWDGKYLKPEVNTAISLRWSSLEFLYGTDNLDYPLQWGVFHRYVNGVKLLPLPTNFWPFNDLCLKPKAVRHQHTKHYRSILP